MLDVDDYFNLPDVDDYIYIYDDIILYDENGNMIVLDRYSTDILCRW